MKLLVLTVLTLLMLMPAAAGAVQDGAELWYFWGDGCPACKDAALWLDDLAKIYPDLVIHRAEVWKDQDERARYLQMLEEREVQATWVPAFIHEDRVWQGFNATISGEIEQELASKLPASAAPSRRLRPPGAKPGGRDYGQMPLLAATILIALADGFNPCSLWVLTILLAIVLHSGSRFKIAAVGAVFLLVTGLVYGIFIAGFFAVLTVAAHLVWIRWSVAILALGFAAVNIKDFFLYKQGPSLTIPQARKPGIFRGGRELAKDHPLPVLLALTAVFAAGVALIELPCTAGFPIIWTNLATQAGVTSPEFVGLLLLYLLVYLAIEIAVISIVVLTRRALRLQESQGRSLKLVGGMIMAAMAVVLLVRPAALEGLQGSLIVMALALLGAGTVLGIQNLRDRCKEI